MSAPRLATALLIAAAFALLWGLRGRTNHSEDLFIYRAGARLALDGHSPYDQARLAAMVTAQFPDEEMLHANHGYFLPPGAAVVLAPFAPMPWAWAKFAFGALTLAGAGYVLSRLPDWSLIGGRQPSVSGYRDSQTRRADAPRSGTNPAAGWRAWAGFLCVLAAFADPLTDMTWRVGQVALLLVAIWGAGVELARREFGWAAALVWSLATIKPHLALPLWAVALHLGGWRLALKLTLAAGALQLAGVLLCGGPGSVLDFLGALKSGHGRVLFNRLDWNPQITSWNRVALWAGLPATDLGVGGTLAGYAVVGSLLALRVRLAGARPSLAWALAAASASAAVCAQVLPNELCLLWFAWPLAFDWCAAGTPRGRLVAGLLVGGLVLKSVPMEIAAYLADENAAGWLTNTAFATRALGSLSVLLVVLLAGWPQSQTPSRRAA